MGELKGNNMNVYQRTMIMLVFVMAAVSQCLANTTVSLVVSGTDKNIYTITAQDAKSATIKQSFIVMFYVDQVMIEGFRDQVLPVSITKDLSGFTSGAHDVRVELEDNNNTGKVLASATNSVVVKH